ncbi:hypothetical protein Cni_G09575 [Canna indica]|uniref:U-box domain-containing protein n=1 Tax=Canna indica TaxID=4628 RepID=A0AAQ3K2R5_9LILI|nr:hypothetical protein Cni_G09575 [Canna indica]
MDSSAEVPQYFTCPISLQIMKDPVTTSTGITYDRESIERWLSVDVANPTCPLTKQPLPRDSHLTPNHTLRRLIQAWCDSDWIPMLPVAVDSRPSIDQLIRRLSAPHLQLDALRQLSALARGSDSVRRLLAQSGVPKAMMSVITSCSNKIMLIDRIEAALRILHSLKLSPDDLKPIVSGSDHCIINAMTWVLLHGASEETNYRELKSTTTLIFKTVIEAANPGVLEQLKTEFFAAMLSVIRDRISQQATKAALQILLHACLLGRNRIKIVEAGGVKEIVELELVMVPDKRTTELNLGVLSQLCLSADGRAELVGHAAGIAAVAKRILRVSPAADDEGVKIFYSLCRYSATNEVLQEMMSVGAVLKLCLVLQANCSRSVKEKAIWVLRLHSRAWKDCHPCVQAYLLTRCS